MDLDDPMDESILSQSTNKTSKVKKSKTKAKNPRAKRGDSVDVNSQMDIDSTEYADPEPEPPHSKRVTRGRKRSSGVANLDEQDELDKKATDQPQPKKRATKNRDSAAQRDHDESSHALPEDTHAQEEPAPQERKPKRGRPSKKDIAARKASGASNTSKTISKSRVPRDSELDAALKAGLEGDDNMQISDLAKPNKSGPVEAADDDANELENPDPADATDKRKTTRSSTEDNMDTEMPGTRGPPQSNGTENATETEKRGSSMSVETKVTDQEPSEPDHGKAKRGPKKKTTGGRGRKPKKAVKEPETSEHDGQEPSEVKNDMAEQQSEVQKRDSQSSRRRSSMAPPKTTQRYSDIPHEQQFAKSLTESQGSKASGPQVHTSPPAERANDAMSPIPSAPQRLSLSPQSSDAENQPPSAAPSSSRQRVLSPSKKQMSQTPQGAKTPSPTRQDANTGCLKSSHPWVPVDIEDILFAASSDKENANMNGPFSGVKADLTSPEKRMTVEEWISWNAKNGEDRLKRECERLVSEFEREGGRAMRALEGIESID